MLNSTNVEPVIRRSALTQISVMLEDPMLHQTFLDNNGVETVKVVMKSALSERDYRDYPDSVIGAIATLKSLCIYNPRLRHELSSETDVYHGALRGTRQDD